VTIGHDSDPAADADGTLPWTLLLGLDAAACPAACSDEAWCGVLAEVALDTPPTAEAFLAAAVPFCNEQLWGTLSCALFLPPSAEEDAPAACEAAIDALKYGSVNVNTVTGMGYFIPRLTWGAHIGHVPQDIQSGVGTVHNARMYRHVQKTVLRAAWDWPFTPFYLNTNANYEGIAEGILRFYHAPNFVNFVYAALQGLIG